MTSTTHCVAPEEIMAFLDGELSAVAAQTVSAHLKDCAQCAMVAEQFRATSQMLSGWDIEAAPAALEDSVGRLAAKAAARRAVVKSRSAGFSRSGGFRGRRLPVIGAVAVVALLVVVVFFPFSRQSAPRRELVLADKPIAGYVQPQQSAERMRGPAVTPYSRSSRALAGVANGSIGALSEDQLEASSTPAPMIARAASLTIRVKDVEASRLSLDSILARHHGYPAQLNVNSPENGPRGFQASLRIPEAEMVSAVGEIKGLGRLENESQSGEDVTWEHADVRLG